MEMVPFQFVHMNFSGHYDQSWNQIISRFSLTMQSLPYIIGTFWITTAPLKTSKIMK